MGIASIASIAAVSALKQLFGAKSTPATAATQSSGALHLRTHHGKDYAGSGITQAGTAQAGEGANLLDIRT